MTDDIGQDRPNDRHVNCVVRQVGQSTTYLATYLYIRLPPSDNVRTMYSVQCTVSIVNRQRADRFFFTFGKMHGSLLKTFDINGKMNYNVKIRIIRIPSTAVTDLGVKRKVNTAHGL